MTTLYRNPPPPSSSRCQFSLPFTGAVKPRQDVMRGFRGAALLTSLLIYVPPVQMTYIFVYGTLKKGQPNYFRMLPDQGNGKAEFCGHARTVDGYPLVIAGKYNIPYLLNRPGEGHRIQGEVYRVDDNMLSFLDAFEGCPTMYQRTSVQIELEDWKVEGRERSPGSMMEAFLYSTTSYQPAWLKHNFYENYDAYGDHGLVYIDREDREIH